MNFSIATTTQIKLEIFAISWQAGLLFIFPLLTLFGNLLVVISVAMEKCLHNATNYFIVSLAIADICLAVLVMPLASFVEMYNGVWIYSQLFCDVFLMFDVFFCTASIMNLTAISLDRYVAVSHPLQYAKHNNSLRVHLTMVIVWILSFCISLPIACGLNHSDRSQFPISCEFLNADFIIYSSLGSFFLPTILMIWLYYRIFKVIRRQTLTLRIPEPKSTVLENNHKHPPIPKKQKKPQCKSQNIKSNNQNLHNEVVPIKVEPTLKCPISQNGILTVNHKVSSRPRSFQLENFVNENYWTSENSTLINQYAKLNHASCPKDYSEKFSVVKKYKIPRSATESFYCSKEFLKKIISIKNECFERFIELDNLKYSKCQLFYNPFDNTEELNGISSPRLSVSSISFTDVETFSQYDERPIDIIIKNENTKEFSSSFIIANDEKSKLVNKTVKTFKSSLAKKLSPIKESIEIHKRYHRTLNTIDSDLSNKTSNTCRFVCEPFQKWKIQFIFNCNLFKRKVKVKKKPEKNAIRREKKAIKTLAVVLGAFLFCWMPFFVANMTNAICFKTESHVNSVRQLICPVPQTLMSICVWLGYINSFLNPVIYTVCNAEFRRIFKKILHIS